MDGRRRSVRADEIALRLLSEPGAVATGHIFRRLEHLGSKAVVRDLLRHHRAQALEEGL